jgi:hypothetical protein
MLLDRQYFRQMVERLAQDDPEGKLDQVAARLEDSAEAMQILRALGYRGDTLAAMVRKVPPATLRHS